MNLLVALDALLTERSVTRAAERLHLSQPALSASLSKLRTHFGDQILARHGSTYALTALAVRLASHTSLALEAARRVFEIQSSWSPSASTRQFVIYGSDYGFATVGAAASRLAREESPGATFRFLRHSPQIVDDVGAVLRSADAMIIPHGHIQDLPYEDLWQDRWVVIASADNAAVADGLTLELAAELPWAFTYRGGSAFTTAAMQLEALGVEARVEVVAESFLALPAFVLGTDRLALTQAGVVERAGLPAGLRVLDPPFVASPVMNALWWHPAHTDDPEHAWMRAMFARAAASLQSPGSVSHRSS